MKTKSRIVRWGTLAAVIAVMSGCCIAPWGGPRGGYYGHGYYDHGGYEHGGGWHH